MYAFTVLVLFCFCCCWLSSGFWCWWCTAPRACKFVRGIALYKSYYYYNSCITGPPPLVGHITFFFQCTTGSVSHAHTDTMQLVKLRTTLCGCSWTEYRNLQVAAGHCWVKPLCIQHEPRIPFQRWLCAPEGVRLWALALWTRGRATLPAPLKGTFCQAREAKLLELF